MIFIIMFLLFFNKNNSLVLSSILFCIFSLIHWHRLEKGFLRLSVPIAINCIVGLGSVLFHSHGSRLFQFTDEIPMILTISYGIGIYHEELYYQKTQSVGCEQN